MVDRDLEKLESLYTANENVKCISTLENSLAVLQQLRHGITISESVSHSVVFDSLELPYNISNSTLDIYQFKENSFSRELKPYTYTKTCA